ncbi:hypothetical protein D3H65_07715 [Paraflavitalea soli]|uniref:Uncharacterized protein n=1 Tax=Paraflavitalea soli TaxID=2315862 RepID=A0A3B7MHJ0_9BACT|nr:hypothetical protein [Paraflavitalea soli]AXY73874.1 hypothetical protein D3H65_07715 [Paraflavitalea soli]
MNTTMEDYCHKLVNKILFAASQEEVKRYIDTAMKSMVTHKVNGHIIARFADKALLHLKEFSPMDQDAQQWTNIKMAILLFNQLKRTLNSGAIPIS